MRRFLPMLCAGALCGCASVEAPFDAHLQAEGEEVRGCAEWFARLDAGVAEAGVRDTGGGRIAGFPYLRASRLLAALGPAAGASERATQALADRLLAADAEARRFELMNLPQGRMPSLLDAVERTQHCGKLLREIDMASPDSRQLLLERLSPRSATGGVCRDAHPARGTATPPGATVVRYAPPLSPPLPRARAAGILLRGAANPLGIPEPGASDLKDMLAAYAPVFEIPAAADRDRFGAVRWGRDAATPEVDSGVLAVYAAPAWTRYAGKILLQLTYTLWFPGRPAEMGNAAHRPESVVWRVTLAPDGQPLVHESFLSSGCAHAFFPTPLAQARPAPASADALKSPSQTLPRLAPDERPVVRIESGTHEVREVRVERGASGLVRYELRSHDDLRSLPHPGAGRASASSVLAGGQQPAFDDPALIEQRFRLELP